MRGFVSPVRCAQGPFELHATTLHSLWGQVLRVTAIGAVHLHVEIWIDGVKVQDGEIEGDNTSSACQLEASQRAAGGAPGGGGSLPGGPSVGPSAPRSAAPATAPVLLETPAAPQETRIGAPYVGWKDVEVNYWEDIARVHPEGRDVKILVWADALQDFQASKIVISQSVLRPSVSDAEYLAHLRQDHDKREAEAEKAELEKGQREQACLARLAKDDPNRDKCIEKTDSSPPAAADNTVQQPSGPSGPPPLPQAETPPPQPSAHATWVPGSWTWGGARWQWLSGGWRVPDSDIAAKATATAPSLPPPPQAEPIPPRPGPGLEWAPGYWHWSGRWVWVTGRWAAPPSAGLTWHPSAWFVDGGTVRLDPGRWVAR
jgi:hypothetical protein